MKGCKYSVWKILCVATALALVVPRLALGEFGVCPPYSKTFGPDDSPEQILAFISELNSRPGGGTLMLEPGDYSEVAENSSIQITGVICVRSSSPGEFAYLASPAPSPLLHVSPGGVLTIRWLDWDSALGVYVAAGATFFGKDSRLALENDGTSYLESGVYDAALNRGTLVMRDGGRLVNRGLHRLGNFENDGGLAFVERSFFQGSVYCDPWDCYSGPYAVSNFNGGVLTLVQSTIGQGEGCQERTGHCACARGIYNDPGSTIYFYASTYDADAECNVVNSGVLEIAHSAMTNCNGVVTDMGYNVVTGCTMSDPTSVEADPQFADVGELSAGSPAIDLIPLELCPPTDALGRARTDGNGDGIIACDAGALEYGYTMVEAMVRTLPYYWQEVGLVDLTASVRVDMYVFSSDAFDATSIVPDSIGVEGFDDGALRGPYPVDPNRDGRMDIQLGYRLDRMAPIPCGYNERTFTAATDDSRQVTGQLKFDAVGCAP